MGALISVIVPVYNVADYLETCVRSILDQRYRDLEILMVDDGSTDGSGALCDALRERDPRIAVYHKENGGLSDARNYGISKAHGDFYAFIDSDDALHRDFFHELMRAQEAYSADIVSGELYCFHHQEELPELFGMTHATKTRVFSREEALKEYLSPAGERILNHGLCMKIYRKELFDGLRFEKGRLHEDLYITYQLLDRAETCVYLDCPYYFYYQRPDSICQVYREKNFLDRAEAYARIYAYFSGREELRNELYRFLTDSWLDLLDKGSRIEETETLRAVKEKTDRMIRPMARESACYGGLRKLLIQASLKDIRVYKLLKKANLF